MKCTTVALASLFALAMVLMPRPVQAAPADDQKAPVVTAAPDKPDKVKDSKDKEKRSKKNDNKDHNPGDGNSGGGNDNKGK